MNAKELFDTIYTVITAICAIGLGAIIALSIVTGALKDAFVRGVEEMKSDWPILLGITIIAFLPFTVSLICGWC